MAPTDFGFSQAARSNMMQEAHRQQDKFLKHQEENRRYVAEIDKSRTDWNLMDASDRIGLSLSTPVAKLGVTLGTLTLPMNNRKTGQQHLFSGGGFGGTVGVTLGGKLWTWEAKGFKLKTANEIAKKIKTGEEIGTVPGVPSIDGEIGVPIFKGPYWNDAKGLDQFAGVVSVTTGTLMTPSKESIGIFNFITNLLKDPKTLLPKTHNLVAVIFYNWKAVPFLVNGIPGSQTVAMKYMEAISFCTKQGNSWTPAGIQGKQSFFKVTEA